MAGAIRPVAGTSGSVAGTIGPVAGAILNGPVAGTIGPVAGTIGLAEVSATTVCMSGTAVGKVRSVARYPYICCTNAEELLYYYFDKMGIITAAYGTYSALCQNYNDKIMKNYAQKALL